MRPPIERQENQITQQHKERRNEGKETCSDDKALGMWRRQEQLQERDLS